MGLSFHYQGRLQEAKLLPKLITELEDICDILGWKSKVFNTTFPKDAYTSPLDDDEYGIMIFPQDTEPVSFVMDSHGRLMNLWLRKMLNENGEGEIKVVTVKLDLNQENPEPEITEDFKSIDMEDMVFQISVKNTSIDTTSYIKVLELIRYLSEKYLTDFKMEDESNYWETRSVEKLNNKMDKINTFIETFDELIKEKKINSPSDFLKFIKMLGQYIKDQNKDI